MHLVTVSRMTESLGDDIAKTLANRLGAKLITRHLAVNDWLSEVATDHELHMLKESPKFYLRPAKSGVTFAAYIERRLIEEARTGAVVICGLGSQVIFRKNPSAVHVRITASHALRIARVQQKYGLKKQRAERTLKLSDRKHRRYVWHVHDCDWSNPALYHLVLNTDGIGVKDAVELIIHLNERMKNNPEPLESSAPDEQGHRSDLEAYNFAHPSEEEFVKILDMHNIQWEYEPTTFPLEWDAEGDIIQAFSPDFYLPEFDTYVELTTMDQKYVTEKNKKARRLRELYSDININIVYKRDYHTLLKRFGIKGDGDA